MKVFIAVARRAPAAGSARPVLAILAIAAAIALVVAASAAAQEPDPVVARVDGVEIRSSDLALAEEEIGTNLPPMTAEGKRDYLVSYLADMVLVAREAENQKIDSGDAFSRRMSYTRRRILMETLLQRSARAAATDEALQKVYAEAVKQLAGEKEVHARHILVETEEEAKAIAADLERGGDFAELAKARSKDRTSAEGGDLGYFTRDQMVPEFADVAFKLEKGEISAPVKTAFGWHLVKVEDKRDRQAPPFSQVREQIENFVVRRAQTELIARLRQGARIERLDSRPEAKPAEPEKK